MKRTIAFPLVSILMLGAVGLGGPLLGCERRDKTTTEKLGDQAKDALNMREHEKMKDAGENVKDAAKDAGQAVQDEAEQKKK
jgi:hypothetical protein